MLTAAACVCDLCIISANPLAGTTHARAWYVRALFTGRYPINRFTMEAKRQLDVINRHLGGLDKVKGNGCSGGPYLCGEQFTIADICVWAWSVMALPPLARHHRRHPYARMRSSAAETIAVPVIISSSFLFAFP